IVAQVYGRCIGCRFCMAACPYTVKYFNWYDYNKKIPRVHKQSGNPDVSIRPKGVVEKCTFCHHRLQKAKDKARLQKREISEDDYIPACAECCPSQAIYFGNLEDEKSEVKRLSESPRAFRLMEGLGTKPKVIYLAERESNDS
ncbi:MAG: 4Fe-4S dicluster domain-containing protein, partial [Deltaproteobacteria bacterium]|nr:4Fe-4S dicluster domain-containing protein [Deltaproteobacteria bacterium]